MMERTKVLSMVAVLALLMGSGAQAALFEAVGVYDEQVYQTNSVNFNMGYSSNTTWTTGIGQTLGASQILTVEQFKPMVEAAFLTGNGGVINFDNASMTNVSSFGTSFAGGTKQFSLTTNPVGGNTSSVVSTDIGSSRTAISGDYMMMGNGERYDLVFGDYDGFAQDEMITAVGVTILGRNGASSSANWRVIAYYTNGEDTGSSSTFRTINMSTGNGTQDSFSGILAPEGYWITRIRVHSDGTGSWSAIDDLAFVTSVIPEPATLSLLGLGSLALLKTRKHR